MEVTDPTNMFSAAKHSRSGGSLHMEVTDPTNMFSAAKHSRSGGNLHMEVTDPTNMFFKAVIGSLVGGPIMLFTTSTYGQVLHMHLDCFSSSMLGMSLGHSSLC